MSAMQFCSESLCPVKHEFLLKHTTTLFSLSDHDILSRNVELVLIKYRPIITVDLLETCAGSPPRVGLRSDLWYYNQSGATELLIMSALHYGRMCFKSGKTLRALHT